MVLFKASPEIPVELIAVDPGRHAGFHRKSLVNLFCGFLGCLGFNVLRLFLADDPFFDQGI